MPTSSDPLCIALLNGFEVSRGGRVLAIPLVAQRTLAFIALHPRPLPRRYVAGQLWPDVPEDRAAGNLRSALWRLRKAGFVDLGVHRDVVEVGEAVEIDTRVVLTRAFQLTLPDVGIDGLRAEHFEGELLPGWYDEWVSIERERLRQVSLHALETLAVRLASAERFGEAIDAALAAVRVEPFRESAHRILMRVHLTEGNVHEAKRHYQFCRDLFRRELGVEPSTLMRELLGRGAGSSPQEVTLR